MKKEDKPHYLGHRKRIKEKFLKSDPHIFQDYELLEILLFSSYLRKDTKEISKALIHKFGSINKLINADISLLTDSLEVNQNTIVSLKIIKEIINRSHYQEIENKPVIDNFKSLLTYCQARLSNLKNEEFRVLFLDKKHKLIEDYCHNTGLVDNVQVDVEKVIRKAIILNSKSIILAHNHPTGNIDPSKNDLVTTGRIEKSLNAVNIKIHDHLIIGTQDKYYSFKENGLI
jgi:DNA repair protein RadC